MNVVAAQSASAGAGLQATSHGHAAGAVSVRTSATPARIPG
nr:hypothetical protein [Halosimplex pelagicum]